MIACLQVMKGENTQSVQSALPPYNSKDVMNVFHFDFQKSLPTLKITVGHQFYLRLLWTYLFGIYSTSSQLTAAHMWHEALAKRGANDVIFCLRILFFRTPWDILQEPSGQCGGQITAQARTKITILFGSFKTLSVEKFTHE